MKSYLLYLESGPRKQKTMVHVLDLLGCIANGPTTDEALARTHDAIRAYLCFLASNGAQIDPEADFTTTVAEHITEGQWLGNGSPQVTFQPDLEPLTQEVAEALIQRWQWLRNDLVAVARRLPSQPGDPGHERTGRANNAILQHVLQAQYGYIQSGIGKATTLWAAIKPLQEGKGDIVEALERTGQIAVERLHNMSDTERQATIQRGKETWTARKMLRRLLEHEWEHLQELSTRVP